MPQSTASGTNEFTRPIAAIVTDDMKRPKAKNRLLFMRSARKLFVNLPRPYVTKKIEPMIPTCVGSTAPDAKSGFLMTE